MASAGMYDSFGRATELPGGLAGGGVLTYSYYANEQVRSISQDGVSKTYALDPAGRQRSTVAYGGTIHTETLHYADGSDSTSWTTTKDGQGTEVAWDRTVAGIDGDLAATTTHDASAGTTTTTLQITNLHGDVIATASTNPNVTALLERFETDEYGNPRQAGGANKRYGWLGAKERRTQLASGVIQMGVRSYIPALGRFTSVDPVFGGSATAYDYANADPLNTFDLDGRKSIPGVWSCDIRKPRVKQRRPQILYAKFRFSCKGEVSPKIKFTARIRQHRGANSDKTVESVTDWTDVGGANFYMEWDGPCEEGKRYHADIEIWFWLKRGTNKQRGPYSIRRRGPSYRCA